MKIDIAKLLVILVAISSFGLASCGKSGGSAGSQFLAQHIGDSCIVQFRRDALGAGASLPISPNTDSQNGADVSQRGKLVAVEREGIVVEQAFSGVPTVMTDWIPCHAILEVRFQQEK